MRRGKADSGEAQLWSRAVVVGGDLDEAVGAEEVRAQRAHDEW